MEHCDSSKIMLRHSWKNGEAVLSNKGQNKINESDLQRAWKPTFTVCLLGSCNLNCTKSGLTCFRDTGSCDEISTDTSIISAGIGKPLICIVGAIWNSTFTSSSAVIAIKCCHILVCERRLFSPYTCNWNDNCWYTDGNTNNAKGQMLSLIGTQLSKLQDKAFV